MKHYIFTNCFVQNSREHPKLVFWNSFAASNFLKKILHFEKRIEEGNKESIDRHAMLRQQIIGLKELNEQMSKEATNLTKALKGDTKTQGNWGEMILERVLERSGLQKGSEYSVQQSFTNANGKRVLPDVVINLPGDKKMIVDSKVSLNAYERYSNETDEHDRKQHLKNHLTAIRNRVSELGNKNYHQLALPSAWPQPCLSHASAMPSAMPQPCLSLASAMPASSTSFNL